MLHVSQYHSSNRTSAHDANSSPSKLAYANTGCIAQIRDHGRKIVFRALMRNLKTGIWDLTPESKFPVEAPEGLTFEHLQFSGIGIDLAVVDSRGFVQVYTLIGALGKMRAAPTSVQPIEGAGSDLDAVVGMHWLPLHPMEFKVSLMFLLVVACDADVFE